METLVWTSKMERAGCVLAVQGDEVHLAVLKGRGFRRRLQDVEEGILEGRHPDELDADSMHSFPLDAIRHIEVSYTGDSLALEFQVGDERPALSFLPGRHNDAREIARDVSRLTSVRLVEGERPIGAFSALVKPLVVAAISSFALFLAYSTAGEQPSGRYRRGVKVFFSWLGETLGDQGTFWLGVVAMVACVAWAGYRLLNRPQESVWDLA